MQLDAPLQEATLALCEQNPFGKCARPRLRHKLVLARARFRPGPPGNFVREGTQAEFACCQGLLFYGKGGARKCFFIYDLQASFGHRGYSHAGIVVSMTDAKTAIAACMEIASCLVSDFLF